MRKETEVDWDLLIQNELEAFENLKKILANPPVRRVSQRGCPYVVDKNASNLALEAVLMKGKEVNGESTSERDDKSGSISGSGPRRS